MNQSKAKRLLPKLRFKIHDRRKLSNPEGSQGRHNKIRKTVTALLKYERIEMNYHRADESRGYAERLIADAIRYGDTHQPTMEMANYWLLEKQLVHKLFKVLVPRYQNIGLSYTKLWRAPNIYPGHGKPKCVIELRNNIFPALGEDKSNNKNLIHNVLLESARKAYNMKKAADAAEAICTAKTSEESQSQAEMNEENAAAANSYVESDSVKMVDAESEEKATSDSVNNSDAEKENSGQVSHLEEDLSKLEITEGKLNKSPSNEEKK